MLIALAGLAPGCRREDPRIRELTRKAAETDEAARELREAWERQMARISLARLAEDLRPAGPLIPLTDKQRRFLEARIRDERDISRQGLLREILAKDLEIRALSGDLARLRLALPAPDVVSADDSHYGLALRFLRARGVPEDRARGLLSRVTLLERLHPGFEVYHFYLDGSYGTWVAQGSAPVSPEAFAREDRDRTEAEAGDARTRGERLRRALADLEARKRAIEQEIAAVQAERTELVAAQARLASDTRERDVRLNALHYLVGTRADLARREIIETPILGRDREGARWTDAAFDRSLDLRTDRILVIQAAELGLARIRRVDLVPGSHVRDEHYRLDLAPDGRSARVEILAPARFRNDKVAFSVSD